ncbi:putative transcription factor MYB-HB-like family [Helianthus annuus]|nr:putative transcription factor MYB-HB-like family [Helianthus annuus]
MGKTVEHADDEPVKMKKKSKKNKNMTDDLMSFGDGNSNVETDSNYTKKKKRDKHTEKKRKSESKDDGETDDDLLMKKKSDKHKEKKRKAESKDGSDEDQHDKGNLVNDDSQKKNKKKKRKYSSEEAQVQENESDQNAGPDVEKDRDLKPEKKEKEDIKKTDKKKKKKTKKTESVVNNTEKPKAKSKSKSKSKKVSFSGHVEVFPTSDTEPEKQTNEDGLVRGKRFTPEEDAIIKQAVLDYVTTKGLGDEGLKMVLNCRSHKGMKHCWQEIGLCIPYRPHTAVYYRAHNLFERAETRSWTSEEIESLKEFHEKYGNDWKKIAEELGKHRFHVKDTWRRIKLANLKGGRWSQEEYQNLYDLVNLDLQMKISGEEKKKSKHGMLRDNIPWTAISEKLSTRSDATCCEKWYNQLTSSLVAEKKWSDADDYRMIGALYELDAACVDDVDWDNVLEHRPGDVCLKRWNQMVKHIGDYGSKTFGEQVDILAERYCPDLAETREVWDKKPVVP